LLRVNTRFVESSIGKQVDEEYYELKGLARSRKI
jgi:hypothetical protein